jgi:phosphatidate cytidylyltransferase
MISKNLKKRIYTSIILFLLIFLILSFNIILVYSLIILGVFSILEFLNLTKKITENKIYSILINLFFIIYVFIFSFFFFFFSNFLQLKIILFSLLLGCVASDVGGFIIGKIFKGPKLTKISPNKTISGSFGSIILSGLVISSSIFYFTESFNYKILVISTITSIACQFGDLFFSFIKRKAKIKDTGNFLPGHGGVLDRLDGIFLGIPIGFLSIIIFFR